ncbi:hypothetical protein AcV5_009657 [Taiwanofungus camphoratus]|nr:hypothetical protein AcV5_009657 [Antrodia cinnamomea]
MALDEKGDTQSDCKDALCAGSGFCAALTSRAPTADELSARLSVLPLPAVSLHRRQSLEARYVLTLWVSQHLAHCTDVLRFPISHALPPGRTSVHQCANSLAHVLTGPPAPHT